MTPKTSDRLRVLVPITGAFHGRLRLRRSTGTLDTEGLDRILSRESLQAIALARQLAPDGADLVAVHVDKGAGEDVLREALSHGIDQGILIEGAQQSESDASTRAATLCDVYKENGPFDAVIGPPRSEFAGFTGALAAMAGQLEVPCFVGVSTIKPLADGKGFRIAYQSLFGDYELEIPRPCVVLAGDILPSHPTAWGIHDAYNVRGLLRTRADQFAVQQALTKRVRIESVQPPSQTLEQVDGATMVRRMRSRGLLPERASGGKR
jgi:electron transfer flavoprotein alpha/beta subunit